MAGSGYFLSRQKVKIMKNIALQSFLIAGGNKTLLAWNKENEKDEIIKQFLGKEVEQIGFVSDKGRLPRLSMMGNELCINATIAFASLLKKSGYLLTSGTRQKLKYTNDGSNTTIRISLPYQVKGNIVLLSGIGYIATKKLLTKKYLLQLANTYKKAAFGMLLFKKNTIYPYVFVKQTDSLIQETSCGSGSIAANILFGIEKVQQPSGEIIIVKKEKNKFAICAQVKKL